jgi:glycosyltransferase involved in cell wall biosynthesis
MTTRILFSCQFSAAYGAVQHSMLDLVRHLDRSRFEPFVLCTPGGKLPALAAREHARVLTVGTGEFWNYTPSNPLGTLRDIISVARQIVKLARAENVRIVHTFDGMVFVAAVLAKLFLKDLQVIWLDCASIQRYRPHNRALLRWCLNHVARVATLSKSRQQQLLAAGLDPTRTAVLPSGTDTHLRQEASDFQSYPHSSIRVGVLGRIVPVESFESFLQMARIEADKYPRVEFVIAGKPGTFRDEIEYWQQMIKRIHELNLGEHVTFESQGEESSALLNSFDLVVSSSPLETSSHLLLEAMALSKPVVATAVGGVPEVVTDGEVGFLVPPNDVEALAARVSQLIEDAPLRKAMGIKARERVLRHYDIRAITREWEKLYDELLPH